MISFFYIHFKTSLQKSFIVTLIRPYLGIPYTITPNIRSVYTILNQAFYKPHRISKINRGGLKSILSQNKCQKKYTRYTHVIKKSYI